ncbi:SH3 domain-containing protein [Humidesulfovibrio mexicanus]|uniref:SH3 domain-containing protein n=1 Tax=Humidesulfovibrio mexicanus TaxID=147047 RepID=A0A238XVV0_9BACT|nr:M48 family metalloprotease [Humidesulfovibrio mexicanus]SNR62820.1 SH3 domain-containing protein [Humidesulfovibrio mexicanus]
MFRARLVLALAVPCLLAAVAFGANAPREARAGAGSDALSEVCWTVVDEAPLRPSASAESGVLARLGRGEAVRVLQAEGNWILALRTDGSKGWVFQGHVAAEAPLPAPASLFEPLPASMILAEAADTARSARSQASTSQIACAELNVALEQHFTPDMLERFLRDGAIAEFAPEQSQPPKAPLWRRITAYGGETERQAGLNLAARILRSKAKAAFGLSLGRYVNLVALAVARHAPGILPGVRVVVLELSEPVSFSLPGGLVMLSTGTLAALDNEAQLALLLAHELAHAALGHLWAGAQGAAFFLRGGTLDRTRAGDPLSTELLDQLEETALVRGLNPKFEYEADLAAMDMAWRAGYDPREYPALLHRMHDAAKGKPRTTAPRDWPALHPQTGERLAHVASMLARIPETGLALARERFQANR